MYSTSWSMWSTTWEWRLYFQTFFPKVWNLWHLQNSHCHKCKLEQHEVEFLEWFYFFQFPLTYWSWKKWWLRNRNQHLEYQQLLLDQYSSDVYILSSGFPYLLARIVFFPNFSAEILKRSEYKKHCIMHFKRSSITDNPDNPAVLFY